MKVEKKHKSLATMAAVSAVGLWSLSPIFISLIGAKAGAAEVFLTAITLAIISGIVISLIKWRTTKTLLKNLNHKSGLLNGVLNASIAGAFIGVWYFGFYQALNYGPKVEVTVIAFIWPLLSIIAMRLFARESAPPLRLKSWLLIAASFIGVSLIAFNNAGGTVNEDGGFWGILWAFIAAVGSGLYLPFAVKASKQFSEIVDPGPLTTFYSVSVSNIAALIVAGLGMIVARYPLNFSSFDISTLLLCAVIGLGVYLFAEVAWTWAFRETASLTLSSLPYFSPAVSVVLLALLFNEKVTVFAVIGLLIIVVSNLWLHFDKNSREGNHNEIKSKDQTIMYDKLDSFSPIIAVKQSSLKCISEDK